MVSRVNGLLRSTCLKAAPFRSDSQFDHDVCVTRIYKWMERAEVAGWFASGCTRAEDGRIHPTAIRRVAVIEVIAILCPVSPAIHAIVLFLPISRGPLFHLHCLGRGVKFARSHNASRITLIFLSLLKCDSNTL